MKNMHIDLEHNNKRRKALDIEVAANYIGCTYMEVMDMAINDLIPCDKRDNDFIFYEDELEDWREMKQEHFDSPIKKLLTGSSSRVEEK